MSTLEVLKKTSILAGIVSVAIAIFIVDYFVKVPGISNVVTVLSDWVTFIEWFGLIFAAASLTVRNVRDIRRQKEEWYFGVITLGALYAGIFGYIIGGVNNPVYSFMVEQVKGVGQAGMFALHGMFILGASLKAIKAKSLTMVAAILSFIIILFFQAPIGEIIWPGFAPLGAWLTDVILNAGTRAFVICAALGSVLLGLRMLLGIDRSYVGGGGKGGKH